MSTFVKGKTPSSRADYSLDEIIDLIGLSLQITPDQHERSETSYNTVGEWLGKDGNPVAGYSPLIYPQGSRLLDTVVRPLSDGEFDIDLVCVLRTCETDPMKLYNMLLKRMKEHGGFDAMLLPQNRCIRIAYKGDYHLDIVPAVPCKRGGHYILIPDREKKEFATSNPRGYHDWLESRCVVIKEASIAAMSAEIHPVKAPAPHYLRPPLKVAVQLLKRWRDVRFKDQMGLSPVSIVLTTLAGEIYGGEQHPTLAFTAIIDGICDRIATADRVLYVENPSNEGECLSRKWEEKPEAYDAFIDGMYELRATWGAIIMSRDMKEISALLKSLFLEAPVTEAIKKFASGFHKAAMEKRLLTERSPGAPLFIAPVAAAPMAAPAIINPSKRFYGG